MGDNLKNGNEHAPRDLKMWREGMGFSVADACDMLGVKQKDYEKWESQEKPTPKYVTLACAALALGIKA